MKPLAMRKGILLAAAAAWLLAAPVSQAADTADFVVWSAYNVKFSSDTRKIYFLASVYVLNLTNQDFRDLTFTARPPKGFTITPPPEAIHLAMRRPEDFREGMQDGAYQMKQKFLGGGQATTLFYELAFTGRPTQVEFPGLQIDYGAAGGPKTFEAVAETYDLTDYGRFSGTISDYIRHYAGFSLDLTPAKKSKKDQTEDWTFSALDYRASGTNPMGIIAVTGTPETKGSFRVQSGFPGDFREILVRWVPKKRGRKEPVTQEYVAKDLDEALKALGDFAVDPASLKWSETKVARLPAVVVDGRWVDQKKARLGSGPFRMYVFYDNRSNRDIFVYVGAQARGVGPEAAETPAPEKEDELMKELEDIVATLRL